MARPRKKFGYDRSTLRPNRRLRFLPSWLTGAGSNRGGSWRKKRAEILEASNNSSVVDGQVATEVAHINPWYLWDGENRPGMHANRKSNFTFAKFEHIFVIRF